jgi:hypothetical protein
MLQAGSCRDGLSGCCAYMQIVHMGRSMHVRALVHSAFRLCSDRQDIMLMYITHATNVIQHVLEQLTDVL